eukprot:TRINITY_DN7955_c0_g1_i1.p1 TRINITY_DN7955_c0_g1~~TRINITY_DN7955_c0_g1_i1.p1  ORF type:complete len:384 (+),score=82.53 TRINITY_DN7955_c0_g1_i1:173-1153(+)
MKEMKELVPRATAVAALLEKRKELSDLEQLLETERCDTELFGMAKHEQQECVSAIQELEQQLKSLFIPKDPDDDKNVIIELRAGTGGAEASLFAYEMLHMYKQYAEAKGLTFELLEITRLEGENEAIRDASASVAGEDAFKLLKNESGVHRVQRIPATENKGRVHTSTMTVAVLPEPTAIDVQIPEADLRIETMRASGAGGQHVNTTDSAVRMTHIPTGITVSIQDERSQHKNKTKALKVIRTRVYEHERKLVMDERALARSEQIGTGDRSERIRTYNFPQSRVTDHRVNHTVHDIEAMMRGELLDDFVEKLLYASQQAALARLDR